MCSCEEWDETELVRHCVRRAYPYRDLTDDEFERITRDALARELQHSVGDTGPISIATGSTSSCERGAAARLAAITSGGAIPDTALFTVVVQPEEIVIGTLDEDFAVESNAGDIMLLGNTSWRITRVESRTGRVLVEDAHGAPPSVPFWRGEAPARTAELSHHVAELRDRVSAMLPNTAPLPTQVAVSEDGSESSPKKRMRGLELSPEVQNAVAWLKERVWARRFRRRATGRIHRDWPRRAGRSTDAEDDHRRAVLRRRRRHAADPARALRRTSQQSLGTGVAQALLPVVQLRIAGRRDRRWTQHRFGGTAQLSARRRFSLPAIGNACNEILEQAALASPIFGTRWRWDANRSLALLRFQGGKKVPPQIQRIRSDDLLASVFPDVAACHENIEGDIQIPDHPLVQEVMKDVLTEAMDLDGLRTVLTGIRDGSIRCLAVDTPIPSQFSHEILNANPYAYLDDAPLEERRSRAVQMRRVLPEAVLKEVGRLDQNAIARVREEALPDVRDADELHDALQTLIALPEDIPDSDWAALVSRWRPWLAELLEGWRVVNATVGERNYWIASERAKEFALIYPDAKFDVSPPELPSNAASRDDALLSMVRGWVMHSGPDECFGARLHAGTVRFGRNPGAVADGGQRIRTARKLHRTSCWERSRYGGMVRPATSGAHSSSDHRNAYVNRWNR